MEDDLFVFKKWPKISKFTDGIMTITQKLDGTNAQIAISSRPNNNELVWRTGSRNQWLVQNDNFGFDKWVYDNIKSLHAVLGDGRHYGEWCGPGIQTGEGLERRKFFSFNPKLYVPDEFKHLIEPVPLLYQGPISLDAVKHSLMNLIEFGSKVNGFDRPEGIVIQIGGTSYKMYLDQIDMLD